MSIGINFTMIRDKTRGLLSVLIQVKRRTSHGKNLMLTISENNRFFSLALVRLMCVKLPGPSKNIKKEQLKKLSYMNSK